MSKKLNIFKISKYIFIKIYFLLNIIFLVGCSSDENIGLKNSVNIF